MRASMKRAGAGRQYNALYASLCILITALLIVLAGCGGAGNTDAAAVSETSESVYGAYDEASEPDSAAYEQTEDGGTMESEELVSASNSLAQRQDDSSAGTQTPSTVQAPPSPDTSNKIIYKGELSIGTKNVPELQSKVVQEVQRLGGYIQSSYSERYDAGLTVRVPKDKFFAFMDSEIFKGEELERKHIVSEDVTLQYSNMAAELESLRIQEERLLTYLSSAKNVSEMLAIEKQLGEVRRAVKTSEEAKKTMDSYISMSEVSLQIYSRAEYPSNTASLRTRLGYAFDDTGFRIKQNFENFLVGCVYFIPVLINLLILAAIVLVIYRQRRRFASIGGKLAGLGKKKKKDGGDDM